MGRARARQTSLRGVSSSQTLAQASVVFDILFVLMLLASTTFLLRELCKARALSGEGCSLPAWEGALGQSERLCSIGRAEYNVAQVFAISWGLDASWASGSGVSAGVCVCVIH